MRKLIILIMLGSLSLSFFSGCKSRMIRGSALGKVSLLSSAEQALAEEDLDELVEEIIAGFNPLEDKRPKEDIAYMTSVREKVSNRILDTLRETQILDEIHTPATKEDAIIITGEIRQFNWESFDTMISYIPGLNVLPFFGLPSTRVDSEVEIYLVIKNTKTDKVILDLNESYGKRRKYNIYNFKQENAEAELAGCFDIVLKKLRDRLMSNKDMILDVAMSIALEEAKQREILKAEERLKAEALPEPKIEEPKVEEVSQVELEEKLETKAEVAAEVKIEEVVEVEVEDTTEEKIEEVSPPQPAVEEKPEIKTEELQSVVEEKPEIKAEEPQQPQSEAITNEEAVEVETENASEAIESQKEEITEQNTGE